VLNPVRMNQIQKRSDQKAASDARKSFPEIISASRMPTSPVSKFSDAIVLSDADLATAKTYQKMLKFGVAPEGVLDKMQKDEITEKIISFVMGESNEGKLSVEEEKTAAKYKKMLSLGLPIGAVRHKMMQEQVDQKIIDFIEGRNPIGIKGSSDMLTDAEETVASKYQRMLKIGLDADAVRHIA
jgi:hypothetical protein